MIEKLAADWYSQDPTRVPRFLWKHLPKDAQRALVLQSIRKEMRFLGYKVDHLSDKALFGYLQQLSCMERR